MLRPHERCFGNVPIEPQAQLRTWQTRSVEPGRDVESVRPHPALGPGLPLRLVAAVPGQGLHTSQLFRGAVLPGQGSPLPGPDRVAGNHAGPASAAGRADLTRPSCRAVPTQLPREPPPAVRLPRSAHRPQSMGTGRPTSCGPSRATSLASLRPPTAIANASRSLQNLATPLPPLPATLRIAAPWPEALGDSGVRRPVPPFAAERENQP